ncbi:acyl-CoA carboxylase subunit beta [Bacillus dakarensis]|uniref:acyl-CoA carboxylase subunit beta n=1 Tax=Robertmurraya dakarensis TaxID=1926278 RepID=UPI00192A23D8|nr:acyl-CoA carboxylase subunit beta [Bacillus dakarensis]
MNSETFRDENKDKTQENRIRRLMDELLVKSDALLDEQRPDAVLKQHSKGKLTARERIELLFDQGTFIEIGKFVQNIGMETMQGIDTPADGIITGIGEVDGRTVAVSASDYTVMGGSMGKIGLEKQARIIKIAKEAGYPLIFLMEGGGHRIQEGLDSREFARGSSGSSFVDLSLMSGWVPLIGAIMGPGFAGPSNFASLCDFIPMVEGSTMGIAGPKLVKAALGEDLTKEELGGAAFHTKVSGMADLTVKNDEECIKEIKKYLSYLPSNAKATPLQIPCNQPLNNVDQSLLKLLPKSTNQAYDMRKILDLIFDHNSVYEIKPQFAKNIITAFARINGKAVGIVANQTRYMGGILDSAACTKASRFVSLCDAFHLPLISFIDVAGFLPGSASEKAGLVRKSAKLLYEFAQATVPKVSVTVGKGYGLAYFAMMGGRTLQSNYSIAWPTAEICAMGIEGAVDVAYYRDYEAADDPVQRRKQLIDKFRSQIGAIRGAEGFGVDDVINPLDTRLLIAKTLERLPEKLLKEVPPRKHGIIPI